MPVRQEDIDAAAALLRADRICAFPTETVYGLGGNARSVIAVRRIYEAKGRPPSNPLIVHVADADAGRELAAAWPDEAEVLAARFWPGPLTLVVPRGAAIPDLVSAGLPTLALRAPAHPVAQRLLATCGLPLAAPSANPSERLSPTTAEHVRRALPGVPVLDGGRCQLGIESTVVDLCARPPRLLRPGALPLYRLRLALPDLAVPPPEQIAADVARAGPGMMARHYAPRARLVLVDDVAEARDWELALPVGALLHGRAQAGLLAQVVERLPEDPEGYAADLYAALHRLDDAGVRTIIALRPPAGELWTAIQDRLRRAATP